MKKFNLLLLLCFGLIFASCTNEVSAGGDSPEPEKPKQEKSYLSLSYKIENEELPENAIKPEKTPESEFSIIELYCDDELHTSWTSDDSESPDSSTASDKLKSSKLSISKGKHTFSLIIKDKNEKILYQSEKLEKDITAGKNEIDFLLSAPKDGKGSLSLTLNWAEDITISKVEAAIFDISENVYNLEDKPDPVALEGFDFTELTVRNRSVVYECENIPAGLYYVKFELYQQIGSELKKLNDSFIEVIYIEKDKLSSGTRTITAIEQFYTIKYNLDTYEFRWKEGYTPVTIRTTNQTVILPTNDDITSRYGYKIAGWYDNRDKKGDLLKVIEAGRKGNVELWSTYAGIADVNISIENKDLSYTRKYENGYLVYTVAEGFDSYTWTINGNAPDGISFIQNENTLSIDVNEVKGQTYNIFVSAVSNNLALSRNIELNEIALFVSEVNDYLSDAAFGSDTLPILILDKNPSSFTELANALKYNKKVPVSLNFELCTDLTRIYNYSFYSCDSLKKVRIWQGIGDEAFAYCPNLETVEINFRGSNYSIDARAFMCSNNVHFYVSEGSNLVTMNDNEILCDKNYKLLCWPSARGEITIPDEITEIGEYAFYYNSMITDVTIPENIKKIDSYAFYRCSELQEVNIEEGLTRIDNYAFSYCNQLKKVYLSDTLQYLSSYVFDNCEQLVDVRLSNNLSSIPSCCFRNCKQLKNLSIPDGVKSIYDSAFSDCIELENLLIPKTLNSIDFSAFKNCKKINFFIDESNENYSSSEDHKMVFSKDKKSLYKWNASGDVKIPDGVEILESYSLSNCEIDSLDLNKVTTIKANALSETYSISKYIIGKELKNFFPISYQRDYEYKAKEVEIYYAGSIEDWCNINMDTGSIYVYSNYHNFFGPRGGKLYINNKLVTELVIPSSVQDIGNYCFKNISGITSITINEGCKSIGNYAFVMYGPKSVESIAIPRSVEKLGAYNFMRSEIKTYVYTNYYYDDLKSILFGEKEGWYYTIYVNNWNDKINGTSISFGSNGNENAELIKSMGSGYYFYRITE